MRGCRNSIYQVGHPRSLQHHFEEMEISHDAQRDARGVNDGGR